jgi:hypothetical protein
VRVELKKENKKNKGSRKSKIEGKLCTNKRKERQGTERKYNRQ